MRGPKSSVDGRPGLLSVVAVVCVVAAVIAAAVWTGRHTGQSAREYLASTAMLNGFDPYTLVASDGTIDEEDLGIYNVAGNILALKADAPVGSVLNVRYNVVSVDGLTNNLGCVLMIMRFRDNGSGARVIARLKRHKISDGTTQTVMTVDSNNQTHAAGFQLGNITNCNLVFDFFNYSYFIDVELQKTSSTGNPGLAMLRLNTIPD